MNYRKIALQLFDELSCIYADDICKHIDLCKRYPMLANEWEQLIIAYISNIEKSKHYNAKEAKEQIKKLSEKIMSEAVDADVVFAEPEKN